MAAPTTRYAKSEGVHVAYQEFGDGPANVVVVPGFVSHIENYWTHPDFTLWLDQLGSFARVVMFDKRGTGLSDRVSDLPGMDERMDDVRAVMDAVGMKRAAVFGTPKAALWRRCSRHTTQNGATLSSSTALLHNSPPGIPRRRLFRACLTTSTVAGVREKACHYSHRPLATIQR